MFGVSCAETTYRLMADPCAEGIVVFSDEGKVRDGNSRRRRRVRRPPMTLTATLSLVCRDLEQREMWDVGFVHSITRFVTTPIRERTENRQRARRIFQLLSRRLEQSLVCGRHLLAGALSAAVCKTVVAPIERVRMDIVLNNTSHGPQGTCMEILRTEGITGFWRGNLLNIIRTAPFRVLPPYDHTKFVKRLCRQSTFLRLTRIASY